MIDAGWWVSEYGLQAGTSTSNLVLVFSFWAIDWESRGPSRGGDVAIHAPIEHGTIFSGTGVD
jgi:hypothetical protein